MTDVPFHQTRLGATFFGHTLPELVRQAERLNENLERLIEVARDEKQLRGKPRDGEQEDAPEGQDAERRV